MYRERAQKYRSSHPGNRNTCHRRRRLQRPGYTPQTPDRDPKRVQQRYRQKSIVAYKKPQDKLHAAHVAIYQLDTMLNDTDKLELTTVRSRVDALICQMFTLVNDDFDRYNANIWPQDTAFAHERQAARDTVSQTCKSLECGRLTFGSWDLEHVRKVCGCCVDGIAIKRATTLLARHFGVAKAVYMLLQWSLREVMMTLREWIRVMEEGWEKHY